jgi:hypothetical protein
MVFTPAQMAKRKLPGLPSRLTETKDLVRRESAEMKAQRESQSQVVALEREVSMLKQRPQRPTGRLASRFYFK